MYIRNRGEKYSLKNDEERTEFIDILNKHLLKNSEYNCSGIVVQGKNNIVKGAVCKDDYNHMHVYKIIGDYPDMCLLNQNGGVVGRYTFEIPTRVVVNTPTPKKEKHHIIKEEEKEELFSTDAATVVFNEPVKEVQNTSEDSTVIEEPEVKEEHKIKSHRKRK